MKFIVNLTTRAAAAAILIGAVVQAAQALTAYQVTVTGTLTSVTGAFDNTVQVGTPFTYSFTWDTALPLDPHSPPVSNSKYQVYTWGAGGVANAATVTFGDVASTPGSLTWNDLVIDNGIAASYNDGCSQISSNGYSITNMNTSGVYLDTYVQLNSEGNPNVFSTYRQQPAIDWNVSSYPSIGESFWWALYPVGGHYTAAVTGAITGISVTLTDQENEPNSTIGGEPLRTEIDTPSISSAVQNATLVSSNPALVTTPATITIPAGSESIDFDAVTSSVSKQTQVTITATIGAQKASVVLTLTPPTVAAVVLNSPIMVANGTTIGTVVLSVPAPSDGVVVSLTSSNPSAVGVPASVSVDGGETSATFTVAAGATTAETAATITAALNASKKTAVATVLQSP